MTDGQTSSDYITLLENATQCSHSSNATRWLHYVWPRSRLAWEVLRKWDQIFDRWWTRDGRIDWRVDEWMAGWTDGRTDGRTHARTHGWRWHMEWDGWVNDRRTSELLDDSVLRTQIRNPTVQCAISGTAGTAGTRSASPEETIWSKNSGSALDVIDHPGELLESLVR